MIMHLVMLPRAIAIERGSKTYVDNRTCRNGHYAHKLVTKRRCSVCSRKANREHMRRKNSDQEYRESQNRRRREKWQKDDSWRNRQKEIQREHYILNRQAKIDYQKEYAANNSGKIKSYTRNYYLINKKYLSDYQRRYAKENREKVRAWSATHKVNRRRRMSTRQTELDRFVVSEAYSLAMERAMMTGFNWHVDHVIPLFAENACGLHKFNNIQVIPAALNQSKNNRMIYLEPLEWLSDV